MTSRMQTMQSGPLEGLQNIVITGPTKDNIRLVYYGGISSGRLHNSLLEYGAVSRLFADTNPWQYYGYNQTCSL